MKAKTVLRAAAVNTRDLFILSDEAGFRILLAKIRRPSTAFCHCLALRVIHSWLPLHFDTSTRSMLCTVLQENTFFQVCIDV
jgi:hypothetical protein